MLCTFSSSYAYKYYFFFFFFMKHINITYYSMFLKKKFLFHNSIPVFLSSPPSLRFDLHPTQQVPISQKQVLAKKKPSISSTSTHQAMTASVGENSVESKTTLAELAPLQAVLFDIDGTICDSDPLHHHCFREMLQEIGFNGGVPITEEFFVDHIAGKHNDDIAESLFPDDIQRGLKFVDDKEAMFRRLASEQLKPVNGLYKVKKWIEDRGIKRAAVTNAPKANAELMISSLGLSDFFEALIVGSECEHAKPHPDPYLKALEIINVSKDHTFVFEDSVSGIKAGVAAGMPVVGIATRNPEHLLMEAKPVFLIKDYEDPKLWAALEELDKK